VLPCLTMPSGATILFPVLPHHAFRSYYVKSALHAQMDQGTDAAHAFLASPGATSTSKAYLTEACLRRLSRLPLADADDEGFT
jgi:hypothetical protein